MKRVPCELQRGQMEALIGGTRLLDSTFIKLHPDASGARCRGAPGDRPLAQPAPGLNGGGWTSKRHALVAGGRTPLSLALSPGRDGDAPRGRALLRRMAARYGQPALIMDPACEGDATRTIAREPGSQTVVPPLAYRTQPWSYDRELYRSRSLVEPFLRRLKRFRRISTSYDKLDLVFLIFIHLAVIYDLLPSVPTGPSIHAPYQLNRRDCTASDPRDLPGNQKSNLNLNSKVLDFVQFGGPPDPFLQSRCPFRASSISSTSTG